MPMTETTIRLGTGVPGCLPCGCGPCSLHLIVNGCHGYRAPGVTVSLYSVPGNALIATGVSNSFTGNAGNLVLSAPSGTYRVVTSHPRFEPLDEEVELVCYGVDTNFNAIGIPHLEPTADYICPCPPEEDAWWTCGLPLKKTMRVVNNLQDNVLLTYAGGAWVGCSQIDALATPADCVDGVGPDDLAMRSIPAHASLACGSDGIWRIAWNTASCTRSGFGGTYPREADCAAAANDWPFFVTAEFTSYSCPPGATICFEAVEGSGFGENTVYEDGYSPDPPTVLTVRAHRPDCPGPPPTVGDPVPDVVLTLRRTGSTTILDTCTTNAEGTCDLTLDGWGSYEVTAEEPGGCTGTTHVAVAPCSHSAGTPALADVTLCCIHDVCVKVLDQETDEAVPESKVTGLVTVPAETDGEGEVCRDLTWTDLRGLPTVGAGCSIHRKRVTASKTGYLDQCIDIDLECDVTPEPTILPLFRLGRYYVAPPVTCEDLGCLSPGPIGRNLVHAQITVQPSAEAQNPEGGEWYSLLGDREGLSTTFNLDFGSLESGTSSTGSPFGDGSRVVEYYAQGTGLFDLPGAGCPLPYTNWKCWIRQGVGAIWEWTRPGYTPADDATCAPVTIPDGPTDCATCTSGSTPPRRFRIVMDGAPSFCLPVTVDFSGLGKGQGTEGADDTFRYRIQAGGGAALERIQSTIATGDGTSAAASWDAETTEGSLLVAVVAADGGTSQSATPPAGWTAVPGTLQQFGGDTALEIFAIQGALPRSGAEVFTLAADRRWAVWLGEVSGILSSGAVDQVSGAADSGTSSDTDATSTTTQADEIAIAAHALRTFDQMAGSPTNGFGIDQQAASGGIGNAMALAVLVKVLGVTGAQQSAVTWSGVGGGWCATVATFKAD